MTKTKKMRGPGKTPAMVLLSLRLTPEVFAYYKKFPVPREEMRRVLAEKAPPT